MKSPEPTQIPVARVTHVSPGRLRLRIAEHRDDPGYFSSLVKILGRELECAVEAFPITGSLLLQDCPASLDELSRLAESKRLFTLTPPVGRTPFPGHVKRLLALVNQDLRKITQGRLDLPSSAFAALLATGIYQLVRGRITAPPWYTAFWFAMGLYTTSLAKNPDPDPGEE